MACFPATRLLPCLLGLLAGAASLHAQTKPQPAPRLSLQAVALPGTGFNSGAGFDVIDWNADGLPDLYIHDAGSIARGVIHFNTGVKGKPQFNPVGTPHHYNCTETFPQTIEHNQARTFCDLNHDGLPDMILFDGRLRYLPDTGHPTGWNMWHLWKNAATGEFFPGTAAMVNENARLSAGPESMFWDKGIFARQAITFAAGDFDNDGLQDIVICRMTTEQPGVRKYPAPWEQWTPRGRMATKLNQPLPPFTGPLTLGPLASPPTRETLFYKNTGTKAVPSFDKGVPLAAGSPAGPLIAPNPVLVDIDSDSAVDILSSEAPYASNAFRVDWPTTANVVWFKRKSPASSDFAPAVPLLVDNQTPIPAGTMARLADMRGTGALDLLVMDADASIRWYINKSPKGAAPVFEPAQIIRGGEFPRFDFMFQPILVDWFAPGSRDLILHGVTDPHCKWGLRRTTLFKNIATKPGEVRYQRIGDFTFNGDPAVVSPADQETPYGVYGSYASVMPDKGQGKRLLMSVDGKVFLFSNLAADGLTFQKRVPIPLAARRDIFRGWQDFPVTLDKPISYIRLSNSGNSFKMINLLAFEAISNGKNIATLDQGAAVTNTYPPGTSQYAMVRNTDTMLTPGARPDDKKFNATTFGFNVGGIVVKLPQPAKIDRFRINISDRTEAWYESFVPFEWQGKTYRMTEELGQYFAQICIEVSPDGTNWTKPVDAIVDEMSRANPIPIDWNNDGKTDLVVAALGSNEFLYPSTLSYRLYLNQGTEESPVFGQPILASTEKNQPLAPRVPWTAGYAPVAGLKLVDMDSDGKLDLLVESPSISSSTVQWHKNISDQPAGFTFESQPRELVSDLAAFSHSGRYRYFDYADADGDGVRDLLNVGSMYQRLYFVRGIHADAPAAVTDLTLDSRSPSGTTLSWTRPATGEKFELRWSDATPADELNWPTLPSVSGAYTVPVGQRQQAVIPAITPARRVYSSVKSINAVGHASSASRMLDFVPAPASVLTLANGVPESSGKPYAGNTAVVLAQGKQGEEAAPPPQTISIAGPSANFSTGMPAANAWCTVIRFDALPKTPVSGATLRLTALDADYAVRLDNAETMSCNQIDIPVDFAAANWQQSAPGTPWPQDYILKSGKFIAFGNGPSAVMSSGPVLRWDVTQAVNHAIAQGKPSVTLLLRLDYTGHYSGGHYRFHAPDAKNISTRPALELVTTN